MIALDQYQHWSSWFNRNYNNTGGRSTIWRFLKDRTLVPPWQIPNIRGELSPCAFSRCIGCGSWFFKDGISSQYKSPLPASCCSPSVEDKPKDVLRMVNGLAMLATKMECASSLLAAESENPGCLKKFRKIKPMPEIKLKVAQQPLNQIFPRLFR